MGWAEQLPSGRYRATIRVGARKRNATPGRTYPTAAEAKRVAGREEETQRQPGAHNPKAGRATWGQWGPTWWAGRRVEDSTRARDESRLNVHVIPRWELVRLDEIDRDSVQRWVRDMEAQGLAASTVRSAYHLLSASMKAAHLAGKIPGNPCTSISLPGRPPADDRFLSHEEAERIANYLDEPWRALVWLLAGTGLRWGEMVALHRQRVHLDAARLDVTIAWDQKNRAYKLPKSHESRSVPILDWAGGVLSEHLRDLRLAPLLPTCGVEHPRRLGQRCGSSLVFPGRGGVPVDYDSFRRNHWEPVVGAWRWRTPRGELYRSAAEARAKEGAAELTRAWEPGLARIAEPVTIHDLRHTYASWFLHNGGTLEELKDILGHSSVTVTERYAHLQKDRFTKIRERMAGMGPRTAAEAPDSGDVVPLRRVSGAS